MKLVTFKLDEELLEELDKKALKEGLTRSEAIRRAIEEWLNSSRKWRRLTIRKVVLR